MVSRIPLVRAAVDVQGVIQEICFHQAPSTVSTQVPDLAMAHFARGQAGHHTVVEAQCGVDVIDGTFGAPSTGR